MHQSKRTLTDHAPFTNLYSAVKCRDYSEEQSNKCDDSSPWSSLETAEVIVNSFSCSLTPHMWSIFWTNCKETKIVVLSHETLELTTDCLIFRKFVKLWKIFTAERFSTFVDWKSSQIQVRICTQPQLLCWAQNAIKAAGTNSEFGAHGLFKPGHSCKWSHCKLKNVHTSWFGPPRRGCCRSTVWPRPRTGPSQQWIRRVSLPRCTLQLSSSDPVLGSWLDVLQGRNVLFIFSLNNTNTRRKIGIFIVYFLARKNCSLSVNLSIRALPDFVIAAAQAMVPLDGAPQMQLSSFLHWGYPTVVKLLPA